MIIIAIIIIAIITLKIVFIIDNSWYLFIVNKHRVFLFFNTFFFSLSFLDFVQKTKFKIWETVYYKNLLILRIIQMP